MPNILICCSSLFLSCCLHGMLPILYVGVVRGLPGKAGPLASPVPPFSAMWLVPCVSQCRPWPLLALQPQAKFLPPPFLRGDFI